MTVDLERIKTIRKNKGISILTISQKLGLRSYMGYAHKEKGTCKFKAEELAELAKMFEVDINDLFKESA